MSGQTEAARYVRLPASFAAMPCRDMRIYGKHPDGPFGLVIVNDVEDGEVYYRARYRGFRGGFYRGFNAYRKSVDRWSDPEPSVLAVRVPADCDLARVYGLSRAEASR